MALFQVTQNLHGSLQKFFWKKAKGNLSEISSVYLKIVLYRNLPIIFNKRFKRKELSLKSTVVPGPAALKGGSLIFQPCKHLVSDMPTYKVQNYSPPAHIIATVPLSINSYSLHSPACFVNRQRTQAPLEFTGHGSSSRLFRKKNL